MSAASPVCLGIIANPVSARDVRRVLSHAAGLTLGERANMLLRLVHTVAACGIDQLWLMPEREGLRALLERQLQRAHPPHPLPRLHWLDMPISGNAADTAQAARLLHEREVKAILVFGGDGTHRIVAKHCGHTPIVAISSGTNNAFPPLREITVTALAAALFAQGRIPPAVALRANKALRVCRQDADGTVSREDLALVDIGILNEQILGAKAIADTDTLRTIVVTQASPEAVGLSAVPAMLQPLARHDAGGLVVELQPALGARAAAVPAPQHVLAALAPGLLAELAVLAWYPLTADTPYRLHGQAGLLALDGERELSFDAGQHISIALQENAFFTLDVPACLDYAARRHLLLY